MPSNITKKFDSIYVEPVTKCRNVYYNNCTTTQETVSVPIGSSVPAGYTFKTSIIWTQYNYATNPPTYEIIPELSYNVWYTGNATTSCSSGYNQVCSTRAGYYSSMVNTSWNAYAISSVSVGLGNSFYCEPTKESIGIVVGLTKMLYDTNQSGYVNMDHAFYFHKGYYQIMQNGVIETGVTGTFENGDNFRIEYTDWNKITWFHNDVAVFEQINYNLPSSLVVDLNMYASGDTLNNCEILLREPVSPMPVVGTSNVAGSIGNDVVGFVYGSSLVAGTINEYFAESGTVSGASAVSGYATASDDGNNFYTATHVYGKSYTIHSQGARVDTSFEPLKMTKQDAVETSLQQLRTNIYGGYVEPSFTILSHSLSAMSSEINVLYGNAISCDNAFEPLDSLSSEGVYGEVEASFAGFRTNSFSVPDYDAVMLGYVPSFSVSGSITVNPLSGLVADVPVPTLTANGGGYAELVQPKATLTATGTTNPVGRATLESSKFSITSYAYSGTLSRAFLTYNKYATLTAYSGGVAKLKSSQYTVTSSGVIDTVISGTMAVSDISLTASATVEDFATAYLEVPSVSFIWGNFSESTSPFSLTAEGSVVIQESSEAFAYNTMHNAVTYYTNYGFDNIITVNGVNYGVKSDGLYSLGGDLDISTAIDAEFELHPTNYGTVQTKNVGYLYISSRSSGDFVVDSIADEISYTNYGTIGRGAGDVFNWRARLGKGVKAVNWGFKVKNINGADFQIQSVDALPLEHKRKV